MPLYLSVPLPGPFRYSRRVGGRHTDRFGSAWYWLLGFWAIEAAFWIVVGVTVCIMYLVQYIREREKVAPAPGGGRPGHGGRDRRIGDQRPSQ